MSSNYWRERWIKALVKNGMERSAAEAAFAATYSKQPADQSKSPEIQALMSLDLGQSNFKTASPAHA
ncbi:hypothetical protein ACFQPC_05475 [Herminiimonas glaciei]|uniref:Uncharacterized protein n=1 Tax=Herminiimonas glaciei TaxID=523788 RepID=A0ABW2I972_9BURK